MPLSARAATRRWTVRLLTGPLVIGLLVAWAGTASAHATVVSSFPTNGERLAHAPASVSIIFDQPVRLGAGGLQVLDSTGTPVASGPPTHSSPSTIREGLPGKLPDGAYVANYTVTSVDGHVVSGGIVFLVGNAVAGQVQRLTRHTTSVAGATDKLGQFLSYLGVFSVGGLAFFLAFILTGGPERRRLVRWCLLAAVVSLLGMLVTTGAQAALSNGSWHGAIEWAIVRDILSGSLGRQYGLQIIGLAACLWSLRRTGIGAQAAAFYGLLVSSGAFVLFGHAVASPERWLSIPADIVHAIFAAMWFGGLIGLVVVLRSRTRAARSSGELGPAPPTLGATRPSSAAPVLGAGSSAPAGSATATAVLSRNESVVSGPEAAGVTATGPATILRSTIGVVSRFSTMAAVSVSVLLVAGVLLAIAEVGSVHNLIDTGYGQILLVKVALVGILLLMAAYNRQLLLPHLVTAGGSPFDPSVRAGWRRLLATARIETAVVVAVLAVTAVLANGTPSNGAGAVVRPVPFAQTQPFGDGHVTLRISPNQALVNNMVVQFTGRDGAPTMMAESVSIYFTLPSLNVGPIVVDMVQSGIGRFVLTQIPAPPIVGTWQITLQVQVSAFEQPDVSFVDTVQ